MDITYNNAAISLTLSVGIPEQVDVCAITKDGFFRRVVNEHGLKVATVASTSPLPSPQDIPAIIREPPQMQNPLKEKSLFMLIQYPMKIILAELLSFLRGIPRLSLRVITEIMSSVGISG